jgi:biopolymer transport protein ExbD
MDAHYRANLGSDPNLVPMIDVLLVLLIIAMLAPQRTVLDAVPAAPAPAPASEEPVHEKPSPPLLRIGPQGELELAGTPVAHVELPAALRALASTRMPRMLLVSADSAVRFQVVVEAMDVAKGAGIDVVALE